MKISNPPQPNQQIVSPFGGTLKDIFKGMMHTGYNPRPPERSRLLLLGLRKSFKTSFACSHSRCCVLDWEGGANAVMHKKAFDANLSGVPTLSAGEPGYAEERQWLAAAPWARYLRVKEALLADAKSPEPQFTTVAIDSVDYMIELMCTQFCREQAIEDLGDYKTMGAGYGRVRERFLRELDDLEMAGYGLILNAHLGEKMMHRPDGSDNLRVEPRISDSFYKALMMKVDQIMHISLTVDTIPTKRTTRLPNGQEVEVVDKSKTETVVNIVLRTVPTPENRERGCRVQIPDRLHLPLDGAWDVYAQAYREEVKRVRATLENSERDKTGTEAQAEAA